MARGPCRISVASLTPRLIRIRIAVGDAIPRFSFLDDRGALPIADAGGAQPGARVTHCAEPDSLSLVDTSGRERLRLELGDLRQGDRLSLRFEVLGEQHFYGLGQGGQGFDRLGAARRLWNVHVNHAQGGDIAIPLLLSNRGYGLFFDTASLAMIDAGDSNDRTLIQFTCEDDAVDLYFLGAGDLRTALGDVAALLGRAPMPPRWSLGYMQSTRHFETPDELRDLARAFRARDLPCDAIILLSSYGDMLGWNRGVGHLEIAAPLQPHFDAILRELRESGFRIVTHEYPVLHADSPLFAEAQAKGYLLADGFLAQPPTAAPNTNYSDGQRYIDFSRPEVRRWWWDQHRHLLALGVDGWWLDGGEGPASSTPAADGTGRAPHNAYDLLRQQGFAAGEAGDRPAQRVFLLCRSGGPGMQRHGAACWSGDVNNSFATLETQIGGYYPVAPRSPELFARWFQFGAFCGVLRAHGRSWREHLPFGHGEEVDAICRLYIELRYRLMPYTYTLAWQAHRDGLPPMRPLVLNYPDDPRVWDHGQQFLWGDDILVAPVTRAGATHWPVYLPEGRWYDYWSGAAHDGPGSISVPAPLDRLPLFIRAGAIIPLAPIAATMTILVHPHRGGAFELYEDDGTTTRYRAGHHAVTDIHCEIRAGEIVIDIAAPRGDPDIVPATRRYELHVRLDAPPAAVRPGSPGTSWWRYDGERFLIIGAV